jgi:hypothetical protein
MQKIQRIIFFFALIAVIILPHGLLYADQQVIIYSITEATPTSFSFNGEVFEYQNLVMQVKYGTSTSSLDKTGQTITPLSDNTFTGKIDGVLPNTTYYFELYNASNQAPVSNLNQFKTPDTSKGTVNGQDADVNLPAAPTQNGEIKCDEGAGEYCLLAPLPNIVKVTPTTGLGDYLNIVVKFTIGFAGVLAVVMIVLGGITYMGSESFTKKEDAKGMIGHAIGGLLLALAAFLILNTINPNLVRLHLGISTQSIAVEDIIIPDTVYQSITGNAVPLPGAIDAAAHTVATNTGIPYCVLHALLQVETKGGQAGQIGMDANVKGTKSNKAFLSSGKTYKGVTFNGASDPNKKNDVSKNEITNTPGLGLDWRFSNGIGLVQVTFFPNGYDSGTYTTNPPSWESRNIYPTRDGFTPADMLDMTKNLTEGAKIWKYFNGLPGCTGDYAKTFSAYNGGNSMCSATSPSAYGQNAYGIYQSCLSNG